MKFFFLGGGGRENFVTALDKHVPLKVLCRLLESQDSLL